MKLSKQQKSIVTAIAQQKVYDSFSYLLSCDNNLLTPFVIEHTTPQSNNVYVKSILIDRNTPVKEINENVTFFIKDSNKVRESLVEFVSLLNILEEENLIIKIRSKNIDHPIRYMYQNITCIDSNEPIFIGLLGNYNDIVEDFFHSDYQTKLPTLYRIQIIPTIRMNDFVKHKFRTMKEISSKQSELIGFLGIFIAIATSLISLFFSYYQNNINDSVQNNNNQKTYLLIEKIKNNTENILTNFYLPADSK